MMRYIISILIFPALVFAQQQAYVGETPKLLFKLVDVTDKVTPETGVGITGAECEYSINSADLETCDGTWDQIESSGYYTYQASATMTGSAGPLMVKINDAAAREEVSTIQVIPVPYDGELAGESGTTLTLASGGVDADDQFNIGFELIVYDANGRISARSCISDSTNSGDTVVTREDISALVASGDTYNIASAAGCAALRPTTAGRTLDVAATGEAGLDLDNTTGTIDAAEIGSAAITSAKFASGAIDATAVASNAITSAELADGAITAAKISTGAVDADAIADDAIDAGAIALTGGNKLADIILRRTTANIEASSYGDTLGGKSTYGMIAGQKHKCAISGGNLVCYKSDGTTVLDTRPVTTSSGAAPIIEVGN